MAQGIPLSLRSCHYHRIKTGRHIPLLGWFFPSHWPQRTSSQHGSQQYHFRAAPWSRMWNMYYVLLHQQSTEVSRARGSQKSLRHSSCPRALTAVTSAIWHLLQHLSVGLPPCLQSAARAQIHHGPAFQRGSEGTWALKQSLLSLGLRAPRDLTAVLGGPPHLQGVILQKKMEIGNLRSLILVTCYWMLWTWAWPFSPSPSYSLEFPHLLLVFKISILRQEVYRLQMEEAGHTGYLMWLFHL